MSEKIPETKSFSFVTNYLSYEEVGTKGSKEYYVKGYISTDEVDRANEVVTREAMKSMVNQIKAGNVKLDVEHSTFQEGENDIPVGKIMDAGMDEKGLWVKCVLNKAHSKFKEVWASVKNGFLDAFSIAYKTTEFVNELVDGVNVTLLKGLELLNVAITGNPICRGAKMTESFYKSMKYINENKEVKNMTEENVESKPEAEAEAPKEEEAKEEVKEEVQEEKPEEVKEEEKPAEVGEEAPKEEVEEEKPQPLDEIKSLMKKEIASLKAEVKALKKELAKPQMKGVAQTDIAEVKEEINIKSPMQMIY